MKNLPSGLLTAINNQFGNEPIMVVGIDWGFNIGGVLYADKALNITDGLVTQGRILNVSNLSVVRSQDNYGEISSCSVTMDDHDLHFWNIMNQTGLEGKHVAVYQFFPNIDNSELIVLFIGSIVAPILWNEAEKTLSFSIFSTYIDGEIGEIFTTEDLEDDFGLITVLDKNVIGAMTPLAFGNCLKTKALKTFVGRESVIEDNMEFNDSEYYDDDINGFPYLTQDIYVEDGDQWPQNIEVNFTIDELNMKGKFVGKTLTILNHNIPTDLASQVTFRVSVDPDYTNYNVVWIPTNERLVNKWVMFKDDTYGTIINYCVKQNGYKCTFQEPFLRQYPNYEDESAIVFLMNGAKALQCAVKYSYTWPPLTHLYEVFDNYTFPIGSTIKAVNAIEYQVNQLANSNIKSVYAYRNIPNEVYNPDIDQYEQKGSTRKLCVVPSSYYDIDVVDYTSISFPYSLTSYANEFWDEGEIFVTQSSPVGPNTSDIIKWLLQTYSNLNIDNLSFNSVASKIDKYPSNFVLYSSSKVVQLCRQIAWQARCALKIYNGTAFLIYLSDFPSVVSTLTLSSIQTKGLTVTYTDSERMYTRVKAKFTVPSFLTKVKEEQIYVYENNIPVYGLKETTWDFFIYDNAGYVSKSVDYWLHYYSNSWKKLNIKGMLSSLNLELFDCIQFSFPTVYPLGLSLLKGIVEEWSYNSDNFTIDMVMWTCMMSGTQFETNTFWLVDNSDGLSKIDPTANISLYDYVVPIDVKNKKYPKNYAKIVSSDNETAIDTTPTGKKTYTAKILPSGPENHTLPDSVSKLRQIDPSMTPLIAGDIVEITNWKGIPYASNKTNDAVAFTFSIMNGDYVGGLVIGGDGAIVYIAKPFNIRRTPFDGATLSGITYNYLSDTRRLATRVSDGYEEIQIVTPDYVEDDIIHGVRNIRGQDVTLNGGAEDGKPVMWLQTESYQWAVEDA